VSLFFVVCDVEAAYLVYLVLYGLDFVHVALRGILLAKLRNFLYNTNFSMKNVQSKDTSCAFFCAQIEDFLRENVRDSLHAYIKTPETGMNKGFPQSQSLHKTYIKHT